jgi:CIC family chloride channel protein
VHPVAVRTLAAAATLGSGGSAGSEGPVAVLGAAVGSVLGRLLRFQTRHRKILVGCGAAAGIAGAFNAPFAGAFFALEEILGSFSVGAFSPVVIASVVGALVVRPFMGMHPAFHVPLATDVHPIANAALYPILGIACGLASALFARLNLAAPAALRTMRGPAWVLPLFAGALVGIITASSGGLLAGNGHLAIPAAVFGQMAWYALIALALAKIIATVLTLGGGGSGGVFTPTLFIGAALGGGVGKAMEGIIPGHVVHPEAWALVGMAGMVAGATRAPLTAIFMVFELTDDYGYIIPLMIVAVVAYVTAKRWSPHGLYDGWLAARGEHLAHGADRALMEQIQVGDVVADGVESVLPEASIGEIVALAARSRQAAIPVVDEHGTLVGVVTRHELHDAMVEGSNLKELLVAADLAESIEALSPTQSLRAALAIMNARSRDALPVVGKNASGETYFQGLIARADVLAAYERALEEHV